MRQGLGRQLAISYVVSVVAVFAIAAVLIDNAARDGFLDELTGTSQAEARAVAVALFDQPTQPLTNDLAESLEARITVIDVDGSVLSDSEADPTTMENHNDRPEVVEARSTGSGDSIRFSSTVGTELLYVAVLDGDQVIRLAVPLVDVNERMLPVRLRTILGTLMVTLAGLVVVSIATRRTSRTMQALTESVSQVAAGKSPAEALDDPRLERTADVAILSGAVRSMAGEIDERLSDLQSEQHLRDHLLDSLAEGVLLIRNTTVAYANPSARQMLGTALDGSTLRHHQISELAANQEGPVRMTLGGRTVEVVVAPTDNEEAVVVLRDVTESVRTDAIRRDFVADASHELKTPVASIRAAAETIQSAAEDNDITAVIHFSKQVEASAARLGDIVADLLDLSRLETEEAVTTAEDLADIVRSEVVMAEITHVEVRTDLTSVSADVYRPDLALAVRNLLSNAARHTEKGSITVTVKASETNRAHEPESDAVMRPDTGTSPLVPGASSTEEGRRRVRDAAFPPSTAASKRITETTPGSSDVADRDLLSVGRSVASSSAPTAWAIIEVTDTGSGIPARDLSRIFERFYRVDSDRSRPKGGTGLGLAIVRHVAERHGGTVEVESELGAGSTFRLRLPR